MDFLESTLCSSGNFYQLVDGEQISWKTCELRTNSQERSTVIQYAELNEILIRETSNTNKPKHLGEELYSLNFLITLRVRFPICNFLEQMDSLLVKFQRTEYLEIVSALTPIALICYQYA